MTRCRPWLALIGQPFRRLGALVFRLGPIRKSHNGLAPIRSDQDPDSRLCDRFHLLTTPAGKTFSLLKFFRPCAALPVPSPEQGFLRHERAQKTFISPKQNEKVAKRAFSFGDDCFRHPRPSYPSAGCSSAEPASVSPDTITIIRHPKAGQLNSNQKIEKNKLTNKNTKTPLDSPHSRDG